MVRTCRQLVLGGLVVMAPVSEVLASSPGVRVVVRTGGRTPDDWAQRNVVSARVSEQLSTLDFELDSSSGLRLKVTLAWEDPAETKQRVTVTVLRADELLLARSTSVCESCGTSELLAAVAARVDAVADELRDELRDATAADAPAPTASPAATPQPAASTTTVAPPPEAAAAQDSTVAPPKQRVFSTLGWIGLGAVATGVAGLGVGGSLWARGETFAPGPNPAVTIVTDYRPPGIALMVAGGAVLIAGAVMVGINLSRGRQRRVSASPRLGRGYAGLSLAGRF